MKKIGRPTKYSEDVLKKAMDYVENHRNYGENFKSGLNNV